MDEGLKEQTHEIRADTRQTWLYGPVIASPSGRIPCRVAKLQKEARHAPEHPQGTAPNALAQPETDDHTHTKSSV